MDTKVYTILTEERHSDPDVEVWASAEAAVARAKEIVAYEVGIGHGHEDDVEEEEVDGWLYFCQFSAEGGRVRVEEKTITS